MAENLTPIVSSSEDGGLEVFGVRVSSTEEIRINLKMVYDTIEDLKDKLEEHERKPHIDDPDWEGK